MGNEQWYTNKELFEQLNAMQGDFRDLRAEMKETRTMIRQYNGLREQINDVKEKVDEMEARQEGKQSFAEAIRQWGGWLFALVTLLVLLSQYL